MIKMYTREMESYYSASKDYDELSQRVLFLLNVLEDNNAEIISNSYQGIPLGNGRTLQRFVITYRIDNDEKFNINKIENEANRLYNKYIKNINLN